MLRPDVEPDDPFDDRGFAACPSLVPGFFATCGGATAAVIVRDPAEPPAEGAAALGIEVVARSVIITGISAVRGDRAVLATASATVAAPSVSAATIAMLMVCLT